MGPYSGLIETYGQIFRLLAQVSGWRNNSTNNKNCAHDGNCHRRNLTAVLWTTVSTTSQQVSQPRAARACRRGAQTRTPPPRAAGCTEPPAAWSRCQEMPKEARPARPYQLILRPGATAD
jgi:hypothetical protein